MRLDESTPPPDLLDHPAAFAAERRQHPPAGLGRCRGGRGPAARRDQVRSIRTRCRPRSSAVAPRIYNRARARVPAPARRIRRSGSRRRPRSSPCSRRPDVLTIVMYHYVRDGSRGCRRGRPRSSSGQLDHLTSAYTIVRCADVTRGDGWPADACLLTFDDGLVEHGPSSSRRHSSGAA